MPNDIITTHSYDNANRLTQITHQGAEKGGVSISYTYTLNPVGNRTQVVEANTQGVVADLNIINYAYDPLHRLTYATYNGSLPSAYQYTYDALGNITQSVEMGVTTAKTYNNANQLINSTIGDKETETTAYVYDGAGNLVQTYIVGASHSDKYYSYNQRHLLTSQAANTFLGTQTQASFVYDGNGDRVQEMAYSNGQLASTTTFTNDPIGLTQVLLADDGTTTTANLFGLDLVLQQGDDGNPLTASAPLYLLTDGLGSVRVEMTGGNATATTSYGPYGSIHQQTGTSQTSYGYTGEQFHAGTGLLYLRARYYNPNLHQFMTKDPFSGWDTLPASQNGYSYVHGNPINMIDPSGQIAICFDGGHVSVKWSSHVASGRTGSNFLNVCMNGLRQGGYAGEILTLENLVWSRGTAITAIERAERNNEPIIIVGYSWGGAAALEVMADLSKYYEEYSTTYPPYPALCMIDVGSGDYVDMYVEEQLKRGLGGGVHTFTYTSIDIDLLFLIDPELDFRPAAPNRIYDNVKYSVVVDATRPTAAYAGTPVEFLQDGTRVTGASVNRLILSDHHTIVDPRESSGKQVIELLKMATLKAIGGP